MTPQSEMTSRRAATGISQRAGSRGAHAIPAPSSIPLSPTGRMSGRALLKRGYVTQALIDSTAVLFCFLFVLSVALSIPLALFLLLFADSSIEPRSALPRLA
jgi:hypothetical protein